MDWIDEIYLAWDREFPGADTTALKTITRLARLNVLLTTFQQEALEPVGLVMSDFTVMAALRRYGPPYEAKPSDLYNVLERSSGGMTKMIKRLEELGFVTRTPDPTDGRSSIVRLTRKGLRVHAEAFAAFQAAASDLMSDIPRKRLDEVDQSLQSLIAAFEARFYV
jgi:DNA-binding MarR family transcriptional regulator